MTFTHLTTDELVMIESYFHQGISVAEIVVYLNRTRTPSQRDLVGNANGLFQKDSLPKEIISPESLWGTKHYWKYF